MNVYRIIDNNREGKFIEKVNCMLNGEITIEVKQAGSTKCIAGKYIINQTQCLTKYLRNTLRTEKTPYNIGQPLINLFTKKYH